MACLNEFFLSVRFAKVMVNDTGKDVKEDSPSTVAALFRVKAWVVRRGKAPLGTAPKTASWFSE